MITGSATDSSVYQQLGLARELETQKNDELQLTDFLNLMVTELNNQDPFNPMENTELATQISQFATVSGINQLNESFDGLSSSLVSNQTLQAAGLVGHDVLAPISSGYFAPGQTLDGLVGLDSSVSDLVIRVTDSSGQLVREMNLGTQSGGEVNFSWDGLKDDGEFAPAGRYSISAQAQVDGETVNPYLLMEARVDSVSVSPAGQGLILNLAGLGAIDFNDVAEIR